MENKQQNNQIKTRTLDILEMEGIFRQRKKLVFTVLSLHPYLVLFFSTLFHLRFFIFQIRI